MGVIDDIRLRYGEWTKTSHVAQLQRAEICRSLTDEEGYQYLVVYVEVSIIPVTEYNT